MARYRKGTCNICVELDDGIIALLEYNTTLFAELMATSVNNCIQSPFANGCSMRMTQLHTKWEQDFDHIESMGTPPENGNVRTFLENCWTKQSSLSSSDVGWSHCSISDKWCEASNNNQRNVHILGNSEDKNKNYMSFNFFDKHEFGLTLVSKTCDCS